MIDIDTHNITVLIIFQMKGNLTRRTSYIYTSGIRFNKLYDIIGLRIDVVKIWVIMIFQFNALILYGVS